MGLWDKDELRRKLMSPAEQEAFLRTYGEAARPMLEAALDARVEELAARYEKSWRGFFEYIRGDDDAVLVTRDQAAKMLNVSVASIQRLEQRGELPKPRHFGSRTVRHQLKDVVAFARGKGLPIRPLTKP
jgi:predicted DNA-binding transcriptional regulator AlpA